MLHKPSRAKRAIVFALALATFATAFSSAAENTPNSTGKAGIKSEVLLSEKKLEVEPILAYDKAITQREATETAEPTPAPTPTPEPVYTPPIPYTAEEQAMAEIIVQGECGGSDIAHKRIVTWVFINRAKSPAFAADTIYEVITAENQFSTLHYVYDKSITVDEDTKQAVQEVLSGMAPDTSQGALFFYNPRYTSAKTSAWFETKEFLFEGWGHRFLK